MKDKKQQMSLNEIMEFMGEEGLIDKVRDFDDNLITRKEIEHNWGYESEYIGTLPDAYVNQLVRQGKMPKYVPVNEHGRVWFRSMVPKERPLLYIEQRAIDKMAFQAKKLERKKKAPAEPKPEQNGQLTIDVAEFNAMKERLAQLEENVASASV
jgi:hypothetical protein